MRCLLLTLVLAALAPAQTVLCIGDSITAGAGLAPEHHWHRLLEERLGGDAAVTALGVGGATMLRGTDRPLVETEAWLRAPDAPVDVAVVMLGTNDSVLGRRRCWEQRGHLEEDVDFLLDEVARRFGAPRVLLCSPPPMFPGKPGLDAAREADLTERAPRLRELARRYRDLAPGRPNVEFLDLARALSEEHVTDGVHLTPFGAAALADQVAAILRTEAGPWELVLEDAEVRRSEYHGFRRVDLTLASGAACVVVQPHRTLVGRPWLWRARFFDHQPGLDLALLDLGFHLVYVDVANLYGAPAAVARWEEAYALLTALGLGPKPVLLGLSRGGLPVLEFATRHPDRVGAVVLDNAVCDFRSWPGGRSGKRSDGDWSRLLVAYGLTDEQAMEDGRSPLERLAPLSEAGVPVHVLVGTADVVVPPAENGEALLARYGGPATAWRKPGRGHHPHGLHPPAPLVRALLRELDVDTYNAAAAAQPSVEYRGHPAGWGGGSWWDQLRHMRRLAGSHPELEVVFFGDSITQGLTGAQARVTRAGGGRPIDRFEGAISLGLSGDRTEHLLYRAEHGALALLDPRVIVVQIGINNIHGARHTGAETAEGLERLVSCLREREPQARLVLCGPFPCGRTPDDPRRVAIEAVHARARSLADGEQVQYVDLRPLFLDELGAPNERMAGDALHISPAGQEAWMEALASHLKE